MRRKIYLSAISIIICTIKMNAAVITVNPAGGANYTSLSSAISAALSGDTIMLSGTITGEGVAGEGIIINKNISIFGVSPSTSIIQAAASQNTANRRVITVYANRTVLLKNLTIRHGKTATSGYPQQWGGGILNYGILTVDNCIIRNNNANSSGGGIYNDSYYQVGANGNLTVTNSTVCNNVGADYGSGICSGYFTTVMKLTNVTVFGNTGSSAIALDRSANTYITNCTVANNGSSGIWTYAGGNTLYMKNTIVADNASTDFVLLSGAAVVESHNIVESSSGYTFTGSGTITGQQTYLDLDNVLLDNGSLFETPTLALYASSVAIDAGTSSGMNGVVPIPCKDQRGYMSATTRDIGAFEYDAALNVPGSITVSAHPSPVVACSGSPAVFSISSNAESFQWRKNGNPIRGATSSVLTINSPGVTDAATYDCVLSKSCAVMLSNTATLTLDNAPPAFDVATLPDIVVSCGSAVSAPTATDNCSGSITGITSDPTNFSTPGIYAINWTYSDANGNNSYQTQNVFVEDTIAPVPQLSSLPQITADCYVTLNAPLANDNCAGTLSAITNDPVTYMVPGTYQVNWIYSDGNGNSFTQVQAVLITDAIAPVPDVNSLPLISSSCSVSLVPPTATDNCSGLVMASTSDPTTFSVPGNYTVTWTYNDGNGNTSTQTQQVEVTDNIAPVADVASLPQITADCSVQVAAPSATDNCAGSVIATTSDPQYYNSPGSYIINWVYDDGHGNQSGQSQNIVITDNQAPVPVVSSLPDIHASCGYMALAPQSMDNCAGTVNAHTADPVVFGTTGTYQIEWIYSDGNGNSVSQTQNVIITDQIAPVPDLHTLPAVSAICNVTLTPPGASDNCNGNIIATSSDPISYTEPGQYNVTWIYEDASGNSVSQNQTVIITGLDLSVSQNGNTLVSGATSVSYQWLNCSAGFSLVPGQNTATFSPAVSGDYAVRISNGICADTSACYSVIVTSSEYGYLNNSTSFAFYPNPSSGIVNADLTAFNKILKLSLLNHLGEEVKEWNHLKGGRHSLDLGELASGLYHVRIITEEKVLSDRIIIQ
ncbi:MAG: T9SS C-terminal target domain-containing protein [Bacteroidetes bacterium]|nr:MAG: T9SS C-terminal target domain-containing protein [Bacteroidota bacterium]REK34534.1 MAG: T9SS C-terminal target domain-containing protein [Bacteroidota bacterium]REK51792.1 MAG: T9SS C-terminal target domain-containing protein [Bacteroidota bacterium]